MTNIVLGGANTRLTQTDTVSGHKPPPAFEGTTCPHKIGHPPELRPPFVLYPNTSVPYCLFIYSNQTLVAYTECTRIGLSLPLDGESPPKLVAAGKS